jgi:hypothetical protein
LLIVVSLTTVLCQRRRCRGTAALQIRRDGPIEEYCR